MFSKILFGAALAAHFIAEFLFQTDSIALNKSNLKTKAGEIALLKHTAAIFITSIISMYMLLKGILPLVCAALITVSHVFTDILKARFKAGGKCTLKFLLDQLLHIAFIAAAVYFISSRPNLQLSAFYGLFNEHAALICNIIWSVNIIAAFVWGAAYLIKCILKDSHLYTEPLNQTEQELNKVSTAQAGKWIGILERISILILIAVNQWAAVGLLLTAKSLARHKLLDDKEYSEYFLIGTLLSFLLAVTGGLLLTRLWQI